MGTEQNEQGLLIAEINLNTDTGRAIGVGVLPEDGATEVHATAGRYLDAVATMIANGHEQVHVAFDAGLQQNSLNGGRYLFVAGTNPQLANVVADTLNIDIDPNSIIAVLGPEFCGAEMSDEALRQTVAADLTVVFEVHYPIVATGPLADMMPYLTMIAGQIILQGSYGGDRMVEIQEGPVTKMIPASEHRPLKAVGLAWHTFAQIKFGNFNQYMILEQHYPAWNELSYLVAEQSAVLALGIEEPLSLRMVGYSVHEVITRVMDNIGIGVQPMELSERFAVN